MTVAIKNAAGGTANVSTTTLPDGSVAVNHVTVNPDGSTAVLAQDATLQQATAGIQTLVTTLTSLVKTDPGTF